MRVCPDLMFDAVNARFRTNLYSACLAHPCHSHTRRSVNSAYLCMRPRQLLHIALKIDVHE
jgi:hypothetical protein